MWLFFLSNLDMGGSPISGSPLISYVDATQAVVIFEDQLVSEIAPELATIIS
jgi:hypothetical protein